VTKQLELVIDAKATLGEGPCWDANKQQLYWVDIMEKKVHIYDPQSNSDRFVQLDQYVGAVVPRAESEEVIVACHHGFYSLNLETGHLTPLGNPESDLPNNRFNDGKCDAAGRLWAGTMALNASGNAGTLYCLDTDLSIRPMVKPVTISNGLAWTSDNRTMYYIDTPTKQVVAYDYDAVSGNITNKRVAVTIPEGGGGPDGMTIDAEGMIWVAQWGGFQVSRWNPSTGELLDSVRVPAAQVTSCAFGGENLDELYITTARIGLNEQALAEQPHAGGVFRIKPGVVGVPANHFKG
jgi:sugar lactone lactonase YvrE